MTTTNDFTQRELLIRIDERQKEIQISLIKMEIHLKELNGEVNGNKTNIRRLMYGLVLGSVVFIKESRDLIIKYIVNLF